MTLNGVIAVILRYFTEFVKVVEDVVVKEFTFAISSHDEFLWSPYIKGQTIIFLPCDFYLSFFFPRLISAVGDWMSTILPHMVWP